jgi:hypothetical protein
MNTIKTVLNDGGVKYWIARNSEYSNLDPKW